MAGKLECVEPMKDLGMGRIRDEEMAREATAWVKLGTLFFWVSYICAAIMQEEGTMVSGQEGKSSGECRPCGFHKQYLLHHLEDLANMVDVYQWIMETDQDTVQEDKCAPVMKDIINQNLL